MFCTDTPSIMTHLLQNLPALPPCEITDPSDDITLPRFIEALEKRHKIRLMMIDEYNKAGTIISVFSMNFVCYKRCNCSTKNFLVTANTLKSMLQEMDSTLIGKENYIHEQRGKLGDKDKMIHNQKNEIDRLEKKSKMLEYKVTLSFFFFRLSN